MILSSTLLIIILFLSIIASFKSKSSFPSYWNIPEYRVSSESDSIEVLGRQVYFPACPIILPQHPPRVINTRNNRNIFESISGTSSSSTNASYSQTRNSHKLISAYYGSKYMLPQEVGLLAPDKQYNLNGLFSETSRIVGGQLINRGLSRYLALLVYGTLRRERGFCSAAIVAPDIVITAGHCVLDNRGKTWKNIQVVYGADKAYNFDGEKFDSSEATVHPQFNVFNSSTANFDIAWVKLSTRLPESARFMKINKNDSIPSQYMVLRLAGYGKHSSKNNVRYPDTLLHQVDIPVPETAYCSTRWSSRGDGDVIETGAFCAGYRNGGCGSCSGDSGGPLFQYNEFNIPVLIGVSSRGVSCSQYATPSLYVRISNHTADFLPTDSLNFTSKTAPLYLSSKDVQRPYPSSVGNHGDPRPSPSANEPQPSLSPVLLGVTISGTIALFLIVMSLIIFCSRYSYLRKSKPKESTSQIVEQ